MNYGIELEFFVLDRELKLVPAYKATSNLDGNPVIGELRTGIHNNILDAVFEIKKNLFKETESLRKKGYLISRNQEKIVDNTFIKDLRKSYEYINRKETQFLEEFSIYSSGKTSKVLSRNKYKASLQINFSNNKELLYKEYDKVSIGSNHKYIERQSKKDYSAVFNYVDLIKKLDYAFHYEIKEANRVKGVYAIKEGILGERVEYRSLPNTVDLNKIISVLS
jgi:hypothetical protein